jgi:hypothetical protein
MSIAMEKKAAKQFLCRSLNRRVNRHIYASLWALFMAQLPKRAIKSLSLIEFIARATQNHQFTFK